MFVIFYLLTKWIRISIHQCQYCMISLLSKTLKVMATRAIASIAGLVESEAVTVQFKTFCFFAITVNFLAWVGLLQVRTSFRSLFNSDLLLLHLYTTIGLLTLISHLLLTVRHLLLRRRPHTLLALFLIFIL